MKEVQIKCKGSDTADIEDLVPFQGELKSLSTENYIKLKNEIISLGFSEPISTWYDGSKLNILNGHQRVRTLKQMQTEGYEIPHIPISEIEATDIKQAIKKAHNLVNGDPQFGIVLESKINCIQQ